MQPARPDILGRAGPRPGVVDRRGNRLARALRRLGIGAGERVVAYVDDLASIDALVAVDAAVKLGASVAVVTVPRDAADAASLTRQLVAVPPTLFLASDRGVAALVASRTPARIVGDGPGVLWWRALEAQESDAPIGP